MTFEWLSYVELASRLLQRREPDIEEAYLRASISRAYYGVFGTLWEERGFPAHGSKHQALIMRLLNSFDLSDKRLGADLDRLRRARNAADYETVTVVTPRRTRRALDLAASIQRRMRSR